MRFTRTDRCAEFARCAATAVLLVTLAFPAAGAETQSRLRFWNLTSRTITELYLAKAGTGEFGPNQCLNDPDKVVDADERLDLAGVTPGRYDVRITDKSGRRCLVPNVELVAGGKYAFSIAEADLKDCGK